MNRHLIDKNASLLDALNKLNKLAGDEMTLFVVDNNSCVCGTLTDGDIRRALIKGAKTSDAVDKFTHHQFKFLRSGNIDISMIRQCRDIGIKILPIIDDKGKLEKLVNLNRTPTLLPLSAIIMAGGKGERLRPLTIDTPKPLLKIDGKAIIDYNVEALIECGIDDITVTTRYLADKISAHFNKPISGVNVKCVRENDPLGTLGAASLIYHPKGRATLVMNSDILTSISFEDLYMRHISENADITIAVIPYQVSVPYAILTTDGSQVKGIEEKPAYSYYANAGIYIINNDILDRLNYNERIDATDFVGEALKDGCRITFFPINGTWIDVGSPVDFSHASDIMRHHRNMIGK